MTASAWPAPTGVRLEHGVHPVGTATPRLSWLLPTGLPDCVEAAEIECVRREETVVARVNGPDQVFVAWPFPPLRSRETATVRVRIRVAGRWSDYSAAEQVEATLLDADDWSARFVAAEAEDGTAPLLRGTLNLPAVALRARLHVTALGLHVTSVNGVRVGDEELAPGWTAYQRRLRFRTHDVTSLLRPGPNTIEMLLGNGWYRGRLGWSGGCAHYGERLAGLAQLEVELASGGCFTWGTGPDWTAGGSGILADDLYDGQVTDLARGRGTGGPVEVLDVDLRRLVPPDGPPVRAVATVPAVAVMRSPSGRQLVDLGENLVGRLRVRVRGATAGQRVVVRHAEVLEGGELGVRPLRSAAATDTYLLAGTGDEVCEPVFTAHGFRYAEIEGAAVTPQDVEAVVLASDLRRTGDFTCSDPDVETLHANVVRSWRGNSLDVPTDCPQRDERLGWTGDISVFASTACFLTDSGGFLTSWLADLAAEQQPDGSVPFVVPDVLRTPAPAAAAWGDAAVTVPWTLYERTGDAGVLATQWPSMRAWVDRVSSAIGPDGCWSGGFQFGDWLDPAAPPDDPAAAVTDPDVVATAHLARSADLLTRTAVVLGHAEDARRYAGLASATRAAFARTYVTPTGRISSDTVTAYAMALVWDLLPDAARPGAGARLAHLVRTAAFRISTGFVGTPLVCDALVRAGEPALAYRLLQERSCPSWLYPVTMGATTVWERWDSMLPDGAINPGGMTSFNHYALGAVADWLHRCVAGLAPGAPGYRVITVAPVPGPGLTRAGAHHDTPYGRASVAWERADGVFTLEVEVPPGAVADVQLVGAEPERVGEGRYRFTSRDPVPSDRPATTVRDVLDDPALFAAVVAAAGEGADGSPGPVGIARTLVRHLDRPVADLAEVLRPFWRREDPELDGALSAIAAGCAVRP